MRRTALLLVVLWTLTLAGTVAAHDGPPGPGGPGRSEPDKSGPGGSHDSRPGDLVDRVAAALCYKEAHTLGHDAFAAKYGTSHPFDTCRAQQRPAAKALVDKATAACKGSSNVSGCMHDQLGSVFGQPAGSKNDPRSGQSPHSNELVDEVAGALCFKEAKSLGPDAFKAKYGSSEPLRACRAKSQAAAQAIVDAAVAACKTSAHAGDCVEQHVRAALGVTDHGHKP